MKWKTHKIVTSAIVYSLTGNFVVAVISACGSIIPDKIEYFGKTDYNKWRKKHRQLSHFWPLYFIPALVSFNYLNLPIAQTPVFLSLPLSLFLQGIFWLCIGAILHIIEDAFCGTVPLLGTKRRVGCRLFHVGTIREYVIGYGLSLILYTDAIKRYVL